MAEMARSLTRVGRGAVAPEAVIAAEEVAEAVRDIVRVLGAVAPPEVATAWQTEQSCARAAQELPTQEGRTSVRRGPRV